MNRVVVMDPIILYLSAKVNPNLDQFHNFCQSSCNSLPDKGLRRSVDRRRTPSCQVSIPGRVSHFMNRSIRSYHYRHEQHHLHHSVSPCQYRQIASTSGVSIQQLTTRKANASTSTTITTPTASRANNSITATVALITFSISLVSIRLVCVCPHYTYIIGTIQPQPVMFLSFCVASRYYGRS